MKIVFDTEFTGWVKNTELISIGLVAETGEEFYAEFNDYDKSKIDKWLQTNVIDNLRFSSGIDLVKGYANGDKTKILKSHGTGIKEAIRWWMQVIAKKHSVTKFEIWSDCFAYDWVLFCDLFGGALNIPENIYYIPFDLSTVFKLRGIDPDISREEFSGYVYKEDDAKHNALTDARVIKACLDKLEI